MKGQCQMKNTERNLLDILYANIIDYLNGVPCANMEPLEEEIRERLYNFICKRFSVSILRKFLMSVRERLPSILRNCSPKKKSE